MNERALRERLRDVDLPDQEVARRRVAVAVGDAYAQRSLRPTRPARRRLGSLAVALLGLGLTTVALTTTGAGGAVTHWIRQLFDAVPAAHPLGRLPGHGRLLVLGTQGAWVIDADGARHQLGRYTDATWSPHGLYVAGVRDRQLSAVDPHGNVHWILSAAASIRFPRWGPDGYRIAYRTGRTIRVVAGDGSGDHPVGWDTAAVAPAWRPDATHRLAFLTRKGAVFLSDADHLGGRILVTGLRRATWIGWAGRHHLLAATPTTVVKLGTGRRRRGWGAPAQTTIATAAVAPSGRRAAVLLHGDGTSEIALLDLATMTTQRTLLSVHDTSTGLTWSPDGRWLATTLPRHGRWLLVPVAPGSHPLSVAGLAAAFGGSAGQSRPVGWCCSPLPQG